MSILLGRWLLIKLFDKIKEAGKLPRKLDRWLYQRHSPAEFTSSKEIGTYGFRRATLGITDETLDTIVSLAEYEPETDTTATEEQKETALSILAQAIEAGIATRIEAARLASACVSRAEPHRRLVRRYNAAYRSAKMVQATIRSTTGLDAVFSVEKRSAQRLEGQWVLVSNWTARVTGARTHDVRVKQALYTEGFVKATSSPVSTRLSMFKQLASGNGTVFVNRRGSTFDTTISLMLAEDEAISLTSSGGNSDVKERLKTITAHWERTGWLGACDA